MAYATLQQTRAQMTVGTNATDDTLIAGFLPEATQIIDDYCGQPFVDTIADYWFNGEVGSQNPTLDLTSRPLISTSAVYNGDGSLIDPSKYELLPKGSVYPKTAIRLLMGNGWVSAYTSGTYQPSLPSSYYGPLANRNYAVDAIRVSGTWGFNRRTPNAWRDTGLTLASNATSSTDTLSISGSPAGKLDVGSIIRIGTEQMSISGPVSASTKTSGFTSTSPTVNRGENGTTAAAHTSGDAIYAYIVEPVIARACAMLSAWLYETQLDASANSFSVQEFGGVTITVDLPPRVKKLLAYPYYNWHWGRGT